MGDKIPFLKENGHKYIDKNQTHMKNKKKTAHTIFENRKTHVISFVPKSINFRYTLWIAWSLYGVIQIWLWAIEFLFFISIIRNRYITICHPLKIKWHFSKRSTMYCILGIWVFGSIPSYLWVEFTQVSTNNCKKSLSNIPSYYTVFT